MQKHTKVYMDYFGYDTSDFIPCEVCGAKAIDIHHVIPRSLGGKNNIDNLMALCRTCHDNAHNLQIYRMTIKKITKKRNGSTTERL